MKRRRRNDPDKVRTVRVGVDFGRTIGEISSDPEPFAFDMIAHIIAKLGPEHVFIISKANQEMEKRISCWLDAFSFYDATGFWHGNLIFVREYADKALHVERLGISIFFDDSSKVVSSLVPLPIVERIFWMHAKTTDLRRIPKGFRKKITLTHRWSQTMKFFQKIPARTQGEAFEKVTCGDIVGSKPLS